MRPITIWLKDGTEFELPAALVSSLCKEYREIKVVDELERIHLRSVKLPSRRWSRSGLLRGIENWLKQARERLSADLLAEQKKPGTVTPLRAVQTAGGPPWWSHPDGIKAKGLQYGLSPRAGEHWPEFKARVEAAVAGGVAKQS